MSGQILIGNDFDWYIKGFRNNRTKVFLNAATTYTWVLSTAKRGGGTVVASGSMEYVTSSNGDYVGGLPDDTVLTEDNTYWLQVILVQGGIRGEWNESYVAALRTGKTPFN